jgi:hypothetical protein
LKTSAARAGCVPVTWQQVMLEWQRDWAHRETYDALIMAIVKEHSGAYGMGVDHAYTMVHKSKERVKHGPLLEPVSAGKSAVAAEQALASAHEPQPGQRGLRRRQLGTAPLPPAAPDWSPAVMGNARASPAAQVRCGIHGHVHA